MVEELEELELDDECKTLTVKLRKKDGSLRELELRELNGEERGRYLDRVSARMKVNTQGKTTGLKTFVGLESDLLGDCLYEDGRLMEKKEIQNLPSSTLKKLHDQARRLSGLDDEASDREKKASEEKEETGTE